MTSMAAAALATAHKSAMRRLAAPLAVAVAAVATSGVVGVVDPNQPGHYPLCPFRAVTGLDCPGCGSLRCIHALSHLDVKAALDQNLFTVIALPFIAVTWVRWLQRSSRGQPRPAPLNPRVIKAIAFAVIAFWIVRNLPGVPFLHSGIG
jgi:hypothetical protein